MKELINFIFQPKKVFKTIKEIRLNWLFLFIILLLLNLIKDILSFPIAEQVMNNSHMFDKMPPDQAELFKTMGQKMKYAGLLTTVIWNIIKTLIYATLVVAGVYAFSGKIKFIQALSLVIMLGFILVFGELLNVGIIFLTGIDKITSQYDAFKIGANLLVSCKNIGIGPYISLTFINPFQIWYLLILISGLRTITEIKESSATIISIFIWLITLSATVAIVVFGEMKKVEMGM